MAFAVTKFVAYGIQIPDPVIRRAIQRVSMTVTGDAADVAYDFGTLAGTFWTSAVAHATYGPIAIQALAAMTEIGANAYVFNGITGSILTAYHKAAACTNNEDYTMTIGVGLPIITFKAANAPTSSNITLEWEMNDGITEIVANIG